MAFNLEDYETVEERLVKFWKEYPDGRIETELIEATATRFIVYSKVYRTEADPKPWATGLAFETISDRGVNATSALENCESSSIGRALANAGYAKRGARPSREEMDKVNRHQATDWLAKAAQIRETGDLLALKDLYRSAKANKASQSDLDAIEAMGKALTPAEA